MARIYLIGDQLTATGFELAGVKNVHVANPDNVNEILDKIGDEAEIIAITNNLYEYAEAKINKLQSSGRIISRIPDRSGSGVEIIVRLIKDVIGFDLKR